MQHCIIVKKLNIGADLDKGNIGLAAGCSVHAYVCILWSKCL